MGRLVLLPVLALAGCGALSSADLTIDGVDPASGPNTTAVAVRIEGSGFHLPITTNLDHGTAVVGTIDVTVGDTPLEDTTWQSEQLIEGTVPAGLAVGSYDVTVTIGDQTDVSAGAYTVACALDCPLGCDPSGTRCMELVPSNGLDPAWVQAGTAPLAPTADVVIDTDTGTITPAVAGVVYHQVAPVDCGGGALVGIGVFSFSSIAIPPGVTVRAVGANALALLSAGPIELAGVLDASGGQITPACPDPPRCPGPGGFFGGLYDAFNPEDGHGPGGGGHGYSADGPGDESGGGGGATCGAGGRGGDVGDAAMPPGLGGVPFGAPTIVPLCGGAGGGAGGPASYLGDPGSRGGGGGGAVQLVSAVSVAIEATAAGAPSGITVAGGGGQGDKAATYDDGGGGGGAGGTILIEAPVISVDPGAVLAANGGGGGGGYNGGAIATDGTAGQLSNVAAPGGPGVRTGGTGAAGATLTGQDAQGPSGDGGAGGGGGAGRIRLDARDAMSVTLGGVVSPSAGTCTTTGVVMMQ